MEIATQAILFSLLSEPKISSVRSGRVDTFDLAKVLAQSVTMSRVPCA
jgi:hypothetical protein